MTTQTPTFDARTGAAPGAGHRAMMRQARVVASGAGGSSNGHFSRDYELLSHWVDSEFRLAITPAFVFIAAATSLIWMPLNDALAWLALIFIGKGIVFALCRLFRAFPPDKINVRSWQRVFAAGEFFYLVTWSYGLFEFWDLADPPERVFLVSVQLILLSLRAPHNAAVLPIAHASAVTATLAIVIRCLITGGAVYLGVASIVLLLGFYFFKRAESQHITALEMFSFRAEKDALIAELERERNNSDQARRVAEEANIAKSRFLATMSHELRTPLNAVIGFSEAMKEEMMGPHVVPAYKEYANDIYRSGQHLLKLINDILDLSRIEAGRHELHEQLIRVETIGEDCLNLLKLRADERGIMLSSAFDTPLPVILADERAVRQIWFNLISNAIKFTPRGGTVTLAARSCEDGWLECSVTDTGPGIPEHEVPVILSPFGQGALALEKAKDGAGLGLPIVQGLMHRHDGEFTLESRLRFGTRAVFRFPAARILARDDATGMAEAG